MPLNLSLPIFHRSSRTPFRDPVIRRTLLSIESLEDRAMPAYVLTQSLHGDPTGPQSMGQFGSSVATDTNYHVVGAIAADVGGISDCGEAYVYDAATGALVATLVNPTPAFDDRFGSTVAISGNTVVVGAYNDDTLASDCGQAYIFNATTGALLATLDNPTPAAIAYFGYAVAISGNLVAVGAYADDAGAQDSGQAYVFNATTGALVATLVNPTPAIQDNFSSSVSISGNMVAVGAWRDDTGATDSGQAYIFNAATGALLAALANPSPANSDLFGNSVSLSGNTVVVGAHQDDTFAMNCGQAYVFNATTGALTATLNDPTSAIGDEFGRSVAVSGNTAVVGAYREDTGATDSGRAYAFNATTGALTATFVNPTPEGNDFFGLAVAVAGNSALIGAVLDNTGVIDAGRAYAFNAASGALLNTLANPTLAIGDWFGRSTAVSGNTVVVGAPFDDTIAAESGQVYLFNATTGALTTTLNNPTPTSNDRFGWSVAVSGNIVVVGAYLDDTGATDGGQAYVFNATTGALVATLANPTPAASDQFGLSVAVSGNTVVVGAPFDDTGAADSGSAYVFNATTGALVVTLADTTPLAGDQFGYSVAISGNVAVAGAYLDDTGAGGSGQAYVFDATTGALTATLANPTPAANDFFGYSVAVSGNAAVVGAYQDDTGVANSGQAYAFNATTGALMATFVNPTPANSDFFGYSVSVSGSVAVVGAYQDDTGATNCGQAYVFNAVTGALTATLAKSTPAVNDQLGIAVAVSGNTVVIGANQDLTQNSQQGAAYVFFDDTVAPTVTGVQVITPDPRNTQVTTWDVTFSEAINLATLTAADFTFTAGGPNLLTGSETVALVSGTTYRISSLPAQSANGTYALTISAGGVEDLAGNAGTGSSSDSFVRDTIGPTITSVEVITPDPRNTQVGTWNVTFSETINLATLTSADFSFTAGGPNLLTGGETVALVSGTTYRISGLPAQSTNGTFTLTINASGVQDPLGNSGTGSSSDSFVRDTIGPTIVSVEVITPDPRNTQVTTWNVTFNEPINLATLSAADFSFTAGGPNLLTGGETVALVSGTTYRISGLPAQSTNGTYTLTINASGVQDPLGNSGTGSSSDSFIRDTIGPTITSVEVITPDPHSAQVTTWDVTFSEAINLTTLTFADFTFTGSGPNLLTGSETVSLVSGTTYRIGGLPAQTIDETYTLTSFAAGVQDLAGNAGTGADGSDSFVRDATPATITGLFVDGTAWSAAFRIAAGDTFYGYPAQTGAGQLTDMPWSAIDTIYVHFSEPVAAVSASQIGIRGINETTYSVASVSMFGSTIAKISLSASFDTDRIILDLDGSSGSAIRDLAGNKLAGTWTESVSSFPTTGTAGVNFKYRFVVGVGDADRDGQVRNSDTNLVRANLFVDAGQAGYDIYRDIDGTGQTRNADLNAVRSHLFVDPPTGPGPFRPRGDFRGRENGFVGRSVRGGFTGDNDANRVDRLTSHSIRPVGRGSVAVSKRAAPVQQSDWLDCAFTET